LFLFFLFNQLDKAYSLLSDPRCREIYDKGGNDYYAAVWMRIGSDVFELFALIITPLLLLVFLGLMAVKMDHHSQDNGSNWSWIPVFIPLFMAMFIIFGFAYSFLVCGMRMSPFRWKITSLLIMLWVLLLLVKLEIGNVLIWTAVWGPLFLLEVFHFGLNVQKGVDDINQFEAEKPEERLSFWKKGLIFLRWEMWCMLRLSQDLLIVLRADQILIFNWAIVFIPFFLIFTFLPGIILLAYTRIMGDKRNDMEKRLAGFDFMNNPSHLLLFIAISMVFIIPFLGLLIICLNNNDEYGNDESSMFKVGYVVIPLFIMLGLGWAFNMWASIDELESVRADVKMLINFLGPW